MAGKKPLFSADAAEEYFSTLLTYYMNTGNDIFKRDNEGRHVSDQIYSAEYQKYLGMQIAMREVLEYFAKFELGDTAIRQQEHFRDLTKKVEPLTLDELREAAETGDPVWLVRANCSSWVVIEKVGDRKYLPCVDYAEFGSDEPYDFAISDYGDSFKAYRQKPEEGTV